MSERKSSGCGKFFGTALLLFFGWLFISNLFSQTNTATVDPINQPPPTYPTIITQTIPPVAPVTIPVQPQPPQESAPLSKALPPPPPTVNEVNVTDVVQRAPSSNETITRHYEWQYGFDQWSWDLSVPASLYDYYRALPRSPTPNYSVYVTHPLDDLYIENLVDRIKEAGTQKGYSEYQTIELAISFVQSLPYAADNVTTRFDEYPRYPVETLVDEGGDCEDTAILLAAIIDKMGYGVVLIGLPNHMAVGIKGGDTINGTYWTYAGAKYYYIETTGNGWTIGELPDEYSGISAHIYPMVAVPIITHDWHLVRDGAFEKIVITVDNLGSATAYGLYVSVGYDAGNDQVWNAVHTDSTNLSPDATATFTLTLRPPPLGVHTRLEIQVVSGGVAVDESYSTWVDT